MKKVVNEKKQHCTYLPPARWAYHFIPKVYCCVCCSIYLSNDQTAGSNRSMHTKNAFLMQEVVKNKQDEPISHLPPQERTICTTNKRCEEFEGTPLAQLKTNRAAIHLSEQSKHFRSRGEEKQHKETMQITSPRPLSMLNDIVEQWGVLEGSPLPGRDGKGTLPPVRRRQ